MTHRLMAVHAHPDDESSKGAATCAYYVAAGADVMVVSATGGERGDVLNEELPDRGFAERDLPGLRRIEMAAVQKLLGIQHRWLGYFDSGMPSDDGSVPVNSFAAIAPEISAEPLVRLIREFKPQVMITYDESGGYPHPDHIRNHVISVLAYHAAADPDQYPEAGAPWEVSKLYYERVLNSNRIRSMYDMLLAEVPDSPLVEQMEKMSHWLDKVPVNPTTQVPAGDFFPARDAALKAHTSQVSPTSSFFFWPEDIQLRAWPFEDYELIESRVETTLPESDLFAGIDKEPS